MLSSLRSLRGGWNLLGWADRPVDFSGAGSSSPMIGRLPRSGLWPQPVRDLLLMIALTGLGLVVLAGSD